MDLIKVCEAAQLKADVEKFNIGDTVKIHYKIIEGKTERVQVFEGIVIAMKNSGLRKTFTVRKISYGVGVERTFPLHSPKIVKIEVVRVGRVRRAKLYYIRSRVGKAAKVKEHIQKKSVGEPKKAAKEEKETVASASQPVGEDAKPQKAKKETAKTKVKDTAAKEQAKDSKVKKEQDT